MKRIPALDHALQEVYEWLNDINSHTEWNDNAQALVALRTTLQLLRDNLTLNNCVKLAAQFSPLIRGFYFENWHPSDQPLRERTTEEFLDNLTEILEEYKHPEMDPEQAAIAVFKTLSNKISPLEVNKIFTQLPKGIRKIFEVEV